MTETLLEKLEGMCADAKYGGDPIQPYQIKSLLAEAWNEGWAIGYSDRFELEQNADAVGSTPNPYKETA